METEFEQLIDHVNKSDIIVIIGWAYSGKTSLAEKIVSKIGIKLIQTDDYIKYGWVESVKYIIDDIQSFPVPFIIEGVQGYRLLRTGVREQLFYPDLIIDTSEGGKYQDYDAKQLQFQKTLQKIWVDYTELVRILPEDKRPTLIEVDPYQMN